TQAILRQELVGGPAAQYSYNPMANPIWLTQGTQYLLELYQGASDGYYYGTSSQIGQHLTYYDMRYCNGCTQNTFPTNVLNNYQYGQPDMWYFTKQTIATIPTVTVGTIGSGTLVTSTSGATSVCPGDSAFVSITASGGTGGYTYSWLPTTGMANPNAASTMVLPPTSGMYYCIVTDQCGNTNFDSIYVTINTPPTVSASVSTDSVCIGGSFIPSGSGAVTYSWSGGLVDNAAFFPSATGNYTVTGTDANGCTNIAIATVEVLSLPVVVASATDDTVCSGTAVTLNGSGASTYAWDNGVTDGLSFTPISSMMYIVTGTDAYGCENWDSIAVVVNASPDVLTSSTGAPYCSGAGSATLTASGADSHFWVTPGVTANSITVNPAVTTTYTVIGTDAATGCADTATITVTVHPNPTLAVTGGTSCEGDCITFQSIVTGGTPGYTYFWSPAAGLNSTTIANPIACNGTTTCYTVMVTDTMGCVDLITGVCHNVTPLPDVTVTGPITTCITDGSYPLAGAPSGGTFTGPGVTGSTFSPSAAGTGTHLIIYSFTDSSGCTASDTLSIVVSPCVGVAENTALNGVNAYPNPFENTFIVDLTATGVAMVRITNSLGQMVFEQEMNEGRTEISTSHLSTGVYFLEVSSEKGTTVIKVIKNN
ncbi:MAG TPA: T9SS type A sorting domain-containing protein, partial [Bacteroidia bacterium]|nr:T9SS type A sorting domain-containing protein [Bacteroidia bacterium]